MSVSSARAPGLSNRKLSHLQDESLQRNNSSTSIKRRISNNEAYTYALRVAYLAYLLLPRQKKQVAAPKAIHRSSTSVSDLVKDVSLLRDSKSTKLPHGFTSNLDKRVERVLMGIEKMPGYSDNMVKRTFGAFLNELKKPQFRKSMEKDRRVEDLLLIFYANATKELQKGKTPDDEGWKLMVDRHVALFIRLVNAVLKDNEWSRDRPELSSKLNTMERKLLMHDQDLTSNGSSKSAQMEVEVPRSYDVKDMPLVQTVSKVFKVPTSQAQNDINQNRDTWTEKAALQDLKTYQTHLSLNSKWTLKRDDFDTEEAYETWRKTETTDLSQMVLALLQSDPMLAKSAPRPGGSIDSGYGDANRKRSDTTTDIVSSFVMDQGADMSNLSLEGDGAQNGENPYTFIPPNARDYYRAVVKQALTFDMQDNELEPTEATSETPSIKLLSKDSAELLNEMSLRWRLPQYSRLVLFMDVVREKYESQEVDLDTLDAAFNYLKEPQLEATKKKSNRMSQIVQQSLFDRSMWTLIDYDLNAKILSSLHDALLRELFSLMLLVYDKQPPPLGPTMYILDNHVYDDPLFHKSDEEMDQFCNKLEEALRMRAGEVYRELLAKNIPDTKEQWEFFHVIQLGKAVVKQCEKIQKRYRKHPQIMGVSPISILVSEMLPAFAADARDLVARIMDIVKGSGEEVALQDGFELYGELVSIRKTHAEVLPGQEFGFHIEGLLQDFVWRWIQSTDSNIVGWVEQAVKQDNFQVRPNHPGDIPNDDERHSLSVIDIFRSFNECVKQIIELNWDDDFQYAKFMTATSKSIGVSVARYCELIEQKFNREMDRPTPAQEAAANQTQKEKWMQLAKDTWTQKERAEPFQFLPESLVKLNNIEHAVTQLDKLEREVNVDACAEVIHKHEPPVKGRARGPERFVFTIKIIEAEDLKAGDMNGLSDPYVVLGDEYQKRLAKTRVIYANLTPRWDESVDIITQGPLNVIATIWDWDALGDHDCLGRTSLKLDPSHFRDFMPREYWLDLDTQGRLLLRVSMEGERDDIQFYFGKAFRTLKRTERDMTRKITDKLSAYIHDTLSRRTLRQALNKGTLSSVTSYFNKRPQSVAHTPSAAEINTQLTPLFDYFNENFALMKETLTDSAMVMVMSRLWKEVLVTIESLLVPPLSDKPSQQKQLTSQELDIVFKWLQLLFEFFHAVDEDTGISCGVPIDILKSAKYHDIQTLNFFYFESTEDLVRTSESMASASALRQQNDQARMSRLSAPPTMGFGGAAGLVGMPSRKHKTIMLSRNLGTMKKAKEEKRKEAQAEPSDDMILRILRMRPEAERYLKDRSRQKERLAAAAAAEMIVKQSLTGGGGRMLKHG